MLNHDCVATNVVCFVFVCTSNIYLVISADNEYIICIAHPKVCNQLANRNPYTEEYTTKFEEICDIHNHIRKFMIFFKFRIKLFPTSFPIST